MKPLGKRIFIRDIRTEETTAGGKIVQLEDTRLELTRQQAEVVAVGEGCELGLQVGDWILHEPHRRGPGPDGHTFVLLEEHVVALLSE